MAGEKVCERCGKAYSGAGCPDCTAISRLQFTPSLPYVAFVLGLLLLIGFSITRLAVTSYKAKVEKIAFEWQQRGEDALNHARAAEAVDDFENALVYDRENSGYRLQLATALVKSGRADEARTHLISLWDNRPGDASVNLLLAEIEAQRGDVISAERFYEGAIYGVWPKGTDSFEQRAETRMQLAKLLTRMQRYSEAQAQLLALSSEVGPNSSLHKRIGDALMGAQAPRLAYDEYLQVGRDARSPGRGVEFELAEAAFAENDFARAKQWVNVAMSQYRKKPAPPNLHDFDLRLSAILNSDPYAKGIGELERALRVIRAFNTADTRLGQCFPTYVLGPNTREAVQQQATQLGMPNAIQGKLAASTQSQVQNLSTWAQELRPRMIAAKLRHQDDVQEIAMRFVFQSEQFSLKNCTVPPRAEDNALLSLAKQRWSNE